MAIPKDYDEKSVSSAFGLSRVHEVRSIIYRSVTRFRARALRFWFASIRGELPERSNHQRTLRRWLESVANAKLNRMLTHPR